MSALALTKNFNFFKKPHSLSDYGKNIFSSHNYLGRSSYYKLILHKYVDFASYISIFNNSINLRPIHTDIEIQPRIIGADTKRVIAKYGKPVFVMKENKLTIFVYKLKFSGLKTNFEIHFYNNSVFLINYHYSKLTSMEKEYVLQSITDKYTGTINHDIRNSKITDNKNNIVYIHDVLEGINVSYLSSRESVWYNDMIAEFNIKQEMMNNKIMQEREFFYNSI